MDAVFDQFGVTGQALPIVQHHLHIHVVDGGKSILVSFLERA
jgi:hypothetical protein